MWPLATTGDRQVQDTRGDEPQNAGGRPMNMLLGRPSRQTARCSAQVSSVNRRSRHKLRLALAIVLGAVCANTGQALAAYLQTNLVSDIPGLATITDPLLVNPWGMSRSSTSPFWTSNQGTSTATLYAVTGSTSVSQVLTVNAQGFVGIPTTGAGPQGPTGQVNNTNTASFQLTPGTPSTSARFIFADLNGTISGWAGGLMSTIKVTTPGAVYTGLAINNAGTRLYAADSAGGHIDVFDSTFSPVNLGANAFSDPNIPAGFVPFNVQNIGGKIYVTYAPAGLPAQRAATLGQGFVDAFDEDGAQLQRVITDSRLAAPWGIALAPPGFGEFGGDLLVGNFSFVASEINAFDPMTGAFEGSIPINVGVGNTPGRVVGSDVREWRRQRRRCQHLVLQRWDQWRDSRTLRGPDGSCARDSPPPWHRLRRDDLEARAQEVALDASAFSAGVEGCPRRLRSVRSGMNAEAGPRHGLTARRCALSRMISVMSWIGRIS